MMLQNQDILCTSQDWMTLLSGAEYERVSKDQDALLRIWLAYELMEHFNIPRIEMSFQVHGDRLVAWQRVDGSVVRSPFVPEKQSLFGWEKDGSHHRFMARLHRFCMVFHFHVCGLEMLPVVWRLTADGRGVPMAVPNERFFNLETPVVKRLAFLREKDRQEAAEELRELNNEVLESKVFHFFSRTAHLWSVNHELMREKVLMLSMNHRYATV